MREKKECEGKNCVKKGSKPQKPQKRIFEKTFSSNNLQIQKKDLPLHPHFNGN
jgi:hypothetical protein